MDYKSLFNNRFWKLRNSVVKFIDCVQFTDLVTDFIAGLWLSRFIAFCLSMKLKLGFNFTKKSRLFGIIMSNQVFLNWSEESKRGQLSNQILLEFHKLFGIFYLLSSLLFYLSINLIFKKILELTKLAERKMCRWNWYRLEFHFFHFYQLN